MRAYLLALAANALAAPAPLEPQWNNEIPPPRFQGPGPAAALFVLPEEIVQYCWSGPLPKGVTIRACIREVLLPDRRRVNVMILPLPCPYAYAGEQFAHLVCHEFGHAERQWKHEAE